MSGHELDQAYRAATPQERQRIDAEYTRREAIAEVARKQGLDAAIAYAESNPPRS